MLLRHQVPDDKPLVILDEIHKYAKWRGLIKGLHDTRKSKQRFLVSGSARLDYYRKGGDSLQGRYHYYRLHPFSLRELDPCASSSSLASLLRFGGFPVPVLAGSDRDHRRWQKEHTERILNEDLRDLERVREISLIELSIPWCQAPDSPFQFAPPNGLFHACLKNLTPFSTSSAANGFRDHK